MAKGGGGHGGHGGGHGGGRHRGGKIPKGIRKFLDPSQVQSGKGLYKLAKAMTALQVKPQIHAYQRLANELRGQEVADVSGTARLGRVLGRNVAGAYRGFDAGANQATQNAAALGQMGVNRAQQIGNQAQQEQQQFQSGQVNGTAEAMALRGAPGGGLAQQQLRDLVAGQQQRLSASNQANTQFASAQGNAFTGLAQGIQGAGRIQGAAAQSDLARTIASQSAAIRLKSGQDIREALGKKADVKALKGQQLIATLGQLTKDERDFILGEQATATSRRGQTLDAQSAAASRAQDASQFAATHTASGRPKGTDTSGSSGGGSNQGANTRKRKIRDATGAIARQVAQSGHHGHLSNADWAYVLDHVGGGYNSSILNAARRRYIKKHPGRAKK